MEIEISQEKARKLKDSLKLELHATFTNTEPSYLYSEYLIQTWYSLPNTREALIKFENRGENARDAVGKAWLIVRRSTLIPDID